MHPPSQFAILLVFLAICVSAPNAEKGQRSVIRINAPLRTESWPNLLFMCFCETFLGKGIVIGFEKSHAFCQEVLKYRYLSLGQQVYYYSFLHAWPDCSRIGPPQNMYHTFLVYVQLAISLMKVSWNTMERDGRSKSKPNFQQAFCIYLLVEYSTFSNCTLPNYSFYL